MAYYKHCYDPDEAASYKSCRCDPSRRRQTGMDGWTLHCGKCEVCGRFGHTRRFPGPIDFHGEYCDFHFSKMTRIPRRAMQVYCRRAKLNAQRAAQLICASDLDNCVRYYRHIRNQFLYSNSHDAGFLAARDAYLAEPTEERRVALVSHLPWILPLGEKRLLLQDILSLYDDPP